MSSTNKTTNLELNDWLPNDTSKREDFNNDNYKIDEWAGKVNSQLSSMAYEVAGGTATAITLNMPATLKDGYWKKFIASADNNGAATTINGKPFYKVCSTNPPNLKKDRPYEGYYNLTNDCFFLKASATGTTSADKVLAGETFSTEDITDGVGTMPKRGAPTATLNCGGTYNIQPGYYSGGKVTANSLKSQTPGTATATDIVNGKTAWVNGSKITGISTPCPQNGMCIINNVPLTKSSVITSFDRNCRYPVVVHNNIFYVFIKHGSEIQVFKMDSNLNPTTLISKSPNTYYTDARLSVHYYNNCAYINNDSCFYVYNFITNTWSTITTPTQSINYSGSAQVLVGDKIYCLGYGTHNGNSSGELKANCAYYDITHNTWSDIASMPVAVGYSSAVHYNGKIYLAGGFEFFSSTKKYDFTNRFFIYNIATNTWSTGAGRPINGEDITLVENKGYIYCFGGYGYYNSKWEATDAAYRYNISTNSWNKVIYLAEPSCKISAISYNNAIYLCGGQLNTLRGAIYLP